MRIHRRSDPGPIPGAAFLCRRSRFGAASAFALFAGIGGTSLVFGLLGGVRAIKMPAMILYWMAFWMLLLAVIAAWNLRQALRPNNWLLAISDNQCYLNTRSYLNHHFPGAPVVFEFARREVAAVSRERIRIEHGEDTTTRHRLVIRLKDTSALRELAEALRRERECKVKFRAVDYPVEIAEDGAIHVWWDSISPDIQEAERRIR